jgi:beta-xylosidase
MTWRDPARPVDERVDDLIGRMTLAEKIAQLYGVWVDAQTTAEDVAPLQHELIDASLSWPKLIADGLGQLTRPFGTAPVSVVDGVARLVELQRAVIAASRFGIPAIAHEECLTGFTTYGATIFPTPLGWGASFDPELVREMAATIGHSMRSVGVHQGLAPVLDVVRDPRWGRTEETIGEDPYLVGSIGSAYVGGLQSAGVLATLKHFAGYSASRAGRNFAPVSVGPREFADVFLLPFEMAVREGGAGSVMHSYADVDGVPPAANRWLLTELLRDEWGFTGTVVADYFGIAFLQSQHHVAPTIGDAAGLALTAGVDVELPAVHAFGEPLLSRVQSGQVPEALIDRACRRVLRQKIELGLLDPEWTVEPPTPPDDLDPAGARALARRLAEESVVLLANDGVLPLPAGARVAVVGPLADDPHAMLGCYTFPRHVGLHHEGLPLGVAIPTLLEAMRAQMPGASFVHAQGCAVRGPADDAAIAEAAQAARAADVCVVALGDHAGLFGRGTSGEGCDVADLCLPGPQARLLEAILATGTKTVAVLLSGRPYALGAFAHRLSGVVQAFFPGEEGGHGVAGVLTGRVNPSGRLPVSMPRDPGAQPSTYLGAPLAHANGVSNVDPSPLFPFGHGLSYTTFAWEGFDQSAEMCETGGTLGFSLTVRNTGQRSGAEVIQVYLHDPVAQVARPVHRLIGYARVPLEPGQAKWVSFHFHADLAAFTGLDGTRIVEPGDIELRLAASSTDVRHVIRARLTGPQRVVGPDRRFTMGLSIADS